MVVNNNIIIIIIIIKEMSRLGESQMRQQSMVMGSARLGPFSDYTANCRPVLSSERAPHRNKTAIFRQQKVISGRKSHKGA
jgi:hypothetical protein